MKQLMRGMVWGTGLILFLLVSVPWVWGNILHEEERLDEGGRIQVARSSEEREQEGFITRIEERQDGIVEIVQENTSNLFEQMDRLGKIQQELAAVIRDHTALKLSMAEKIESLRSELDILTIRSTSLQLRLARQIGEGQTKMGRAIVASQRFPAGSTAFRLAQEQLGSVILENAVLQRRAANELGRDQESLGLAIRQHAMFLMKASKEIGRSEERLGQVILAQANMLFKTNKAIEAGKERLHLAVLEVNRIETDVLKQLGRAE